MKTKTMIMWFFFCIILISVFLPVSAADKTSSVCQDACSGQVAAVEFDEAHENKIELRISSDKMRVNGKQVEIDPGKGTVPITRGGRTLVPIRAIIENMGGTIGWNSKESRVNIELNGRLIKLWTGKTSAEVNGRIVNTEIAPEVINGRTMLPLRFIAENLGARIEWNGMTQTVTIYYSNNKTMNDGEKKVSDTKDSNRYVDDNKSQSVSGADLNLFNNLPKSFPEDFPKDIIPLPSGTEVEFEFNSDDAVVGSGVDKYSVSLKINNDVKKVMTLYTDYVHTFKEFSDDPYNGTDTHRTFMAKKETKEGYYDIIIMVSKEKEESHVSVLIDIQYHKSF